jgi:dihydropyrimidinase
MIDLLIEGGTLITGEWAGVADLGVDQGRMVAIGAAGSLAAPRRRVDARGRYVFPGGIDPHVHVHWPFLAATTADDFAVASRAAALGGTTTIIDFAHPKMGPTPLERVANRRAEADGLIAIDYGLHCVLNQGDPETLEQMALLVAGGVTSFKLYMAYSRRGIMVDDATLMRVMSKAASLGALVCVHAENGTVADALEAQTLAEGHALAPDFPRHKPDYVEEEAVERAIFWARRMGARLYILHLSSAAGLDQVRAAQRQGVQVVAETCPQYLLLSEEVYARPGDGHNFICSPPIRSRNDAEALWGGIAEGVITVVGTDHCAFTSAQKDRGRENFVDVPNGLPGIETRLALLYSQGVCAGRISLNQMVAVTSRNPARVFGFANKGSLMPGADADLVIWDPARKWTLAPDTLHMPVDWSPYNGWAMEGAVVMTVASGDIIVEDGTYVAPEHQGHFVPRRPDAVGR